MVVLEVNDVRLQVGAARVAVGKVRQLPAVAVLGPLRALLNTYDRTYVWIRRSIFLPLNLMNTAEHLEPRPISMLYAILGRCRPPR